MAKTQSRKSSAANTPTRHTATGQRRVKSKSGNTDRARAGARAASTGATTPAAPSPSKQQTVLSLLARADGATISAIMETTGWQAHSVRGFLAGTVRRKLGLKLVSDKTEGRDRTYRILAQKAGRGSKANTKAGVDAAPRDEAAS